MQSFSYSLLEDSSTLKYRNRKIFKIICNNAEHCVFLHPRITRKQGMKREPAMKVKGAVMKVKQ